jgi:uncharacterized protein YdhG (YjbR/CyaY superfamily)
LGAGRLSQWLSNTKTITMDEIDNYISNFPEEVQSLLHQIKMIIHEEAPEADEGIAYGMPAYKTNKKPLVYFAAINREEVRCSFL